MESKEHIPFSRPENYLIFRALRFPMRMNPHSLVDETYAENEMRKLSRKAGEPSRIYLENHKTGNLKRSATVMIPSQNIFGSVGYALTPKNDLEVFYFNRDMNHTVTGYGKKNDYSRVNTRVLRSHINEYLRNAPKNLFTDKVNEIILDIKNPNDIQFFYYCIDNTRWADKDGIESNSIANKQLSAIYLQQAFKKKFDRELPIYEYSRLLPEKDQLTKFQYSKDDLKNLLSYSLSQNTNSKDFLALACAFHPIISADNKLLKMVTSKLNREVFYLKLGFSRYKYNYYIPTTNTHVNQPLFQLKNLVHLSKTFRLYQKDEASKHLATQILKKTIKYYMNPTHDIYQKKPHSKHEDVHLRTFLDYSKTCKELMGTRDFQPFENELKDCFEVITKNSNHKNMDFNRIGKKYGNDLPFVKAYPKKLQKNISENIIFSL